MFGMFDIIIALIFIYALFASLVSGINEVIVQMLSMRGRVLLESIAMMLGELPKDTGSSSVTSRVFKWLKHKLGLINTKQTHLTNQLYANPLVDTLSPPGSSLPSYISPQTFSAALVQIMSVDGSIETLKKSMEDRSKPLNKLLGPMLDEAGNDIKKFKTSVENHYNAIMDRVGGWYKRRTQAIMFFVGLVLAVLMNIDSVYIVQHLQKNPDKTLALVEAAEKYSAIKGQTDEEITEKEKLIQKIKELSVKSEEFKNIGLPIGWYSKDKEASESAADQKDSGGSFPFDFLPGQDSKLVFLGWIATALAGALGAPFWFDAISKIFAARGSGRKPG
ncbi:MAG: hypothetical protein KDF59_01745 [Nitrosomonas sp.]|nr:hypothetical protein [Nitrosomonas sp.]